MGAESVATVRAGRTNHRLICRGPSDVSLQRHCSARHFWPRYDGHPFVSGSGAARTECWRSAVTARGDAGGVTVSRETRASRAWHPLGPDASVSFRTTLASVSVSGSVFHVKHQPDCWIWSRSMERYFAEQAGGCVRRCWRDGVEEPSLKSCRWSACAALHAAENDSHTICGAHTARDSLGIRYNRRVSRETSGDHASELLHVQSSRQPRDLVSRETRCG